jgi:glycine oxidase
MKSIVVIGGGVMGLSVGFKLAQRGARVTILERSIPGAEASSAAAGILGAQLEAERPGPFLDLCLKSRALYPEFVAELESISGMRVGHQRCGVLKAAFDAEGVAELEQTVQWQREAQLRADLLTASDAKALEPGLSSGVLAAAHFPEDQTIDNRLLLRALSISAAKVGCEFRTGYVRKVATENGRAVGVDLDGETLRADAVVLAAGSWSALVEGAELGPSAVRPARGQMLQLQTRVPLLNRILVGRGGYLVPRADGRVIAGSTLEFAGFEKQVTAEGLKKILTMALELCPALAEAPVTDFWAGLRPYTDDHLPLLGRGPFSGLFLATGHFRNGILLAAITAEVVSNLVLDERAAIDLRPFDYRRSSQLA